jgi:ribosome-associated translation inhibitor RaiA
MTVPIQVQVTGERTPHIAEYAEQRVRSAFPYAHEPVLNARVRVTRHGDPAVASPVTAQANLDVTGHPVRAQAPAPTAREAVDRLHDRLRRRLQRRLEWGAGHGEARRGHRPSGEPHEWRHGDEPTHRPPYFPRLAEEREVIRHKSFTLARCDIDEAALDMEAMDYDFHLFTERGTGQDSVLYRAGPQNYRLAQVSPHPQALARHSLPLTVSKQPAPVLSVPEAVERMAVWDRPFLFFLDAERGRGAVLYHRYDGHYGLITRAQ